MSFLGLTFLFALPLASAPILLHLFDRQRNVVIEWGAMQFLVQAARRRTSARRLQQWLLLLLRTLAIVCLVMALARPLVHSRWLGTNHQRETILVIDNSLSMSRLRDGRTLYQAAVQSAKDALESTTSGNYARVLLTSPYPVWLTPTSVRLSPAAIEDIYDKLKDQRPTLGRSDLLASLFTAVQAEPTPGMQHRRIALFTDGQALDWNIKDEQGWRRLRDMLQSPQVPTELSIASQDSHNQADRNLAVNRIDASQTSIGPQQLCTVTAQIQNHGQTTSESCSIRWLVSGEEREIGQIPALPADAIHEVSWKTSFSDQGVYEILAKIDTDDSLITDNRATMIVDVVERVSVLVLESAPAAAEDLQDAFFFQAALGWADGEPQGSHGIYAPTLVAPDQFARVDLHPYQAVVIPNLTELSAEVIEKLQRFVFHGGGLWIALGPRTDIERFNQLLFADAEGLVPLAIDRIVDESDVKGHKTMIDPFVTSHPATSSLADGARLDTAKIAVSRRFRFASPSHGENASILLSLSNGEPLAVEKLVGRGRVIVQAVPLRLQWSELARSQAFVVMIQDWLSYLTSPQSTRHNLAPGDPIRLSLPGASDLEATLRTPQGDDIELTAESTEDGVVFRTSRTIVPGNYSLEVGLSGRQIPFHVQRDPQESNLKPLTTADQKMLAEIAGLGRQNADNTITSSAPTDPVWPMLLTLLTGLMIFELLLASRMSRQRFGSDPITETTEQLMDGPSQLPVVVSRGNRSVADRNPTSIRPRS